MKTRRWEIAMSIRNDADFNVTMLFYHFASSHSSCLDLPWLCKHFRFQQKKKSQRAAAAVYSWTMTCSFLGAVHEYFTDFIGKLAFHFICNCCQLIKLLCSTNEWEWSREVDKSSTIDARPILESFTFFSARVQCAFFIAHFTTFNENQKENLFISRIIVNQRVLLTVNVCNKDERLINWHKMHRISPAIIDLHSEIVECINDQSEALALAVFVNTALCRLEVTESADNLARKSHRVEHLTRKLQHDKLDAESHEKFKSP